MILGLVHPQITPCPTDSQKVSPFLMSPQKRFLSGLSVLSSSCTDYITSIIGLESGIPHCHFCYRSLRAFSDFIITGATDSIKKTYP